MNKRAIVSAVLSAAILMGTAQATKINSVGSVPESLGVTFYNNGMALFHDRRTVNLHKGNNTLTLTGLNPSAITDSVRIESRGRLDVREQGRLAPNLSWPDLLKASVGSQVQVAAINPVTGIRTLRDAELISVQNGIIVRIGNQIGTASPEQIILPQIPGRLRPNPTYRISGEAADSGPADLNLSYLSNGFSWHASHVLTIGKQDGTAKLQSWASLSNRSGQDIKGAAIQALAGDIQRRSPPDTVPRMESLTTLKTQAPALAANTNAPSTRQGLAGYHLYTLAGHIDLADHEDKQISLQPAMVIPVSRELVSEASVNPYTPLHGQPTPTHPFIHLVLKNDAAAGSSQPVPGGIIRIYGQDLMGHTQLLGEDTLSDLPLGAKTTIVAGQAFDVKVVREQTAYQRENQERNSFQMAYRVRLTNGGDTSETVSLIEAMAGDWTILEETIPHDRDNSQAKWRIDVPSHGQRVISYRVRLKF